MARDNALAGAQAPKTQLQPSRKYAVWSDAEEGILIAGVKLLGIGSWEAIRHEKSLGLSHRTAIQLKDKWRNLVKYKHVVPEDFPSCIADCRKRQLEEANGGLHFTELAGNSDHKRTRHEFDTLSRRVGPYTSPQSSMPGALPDLEPGHASDSSHDKDGRKLANRSARRAAMANIRQTRDKLLVAHRIQIEANKLFSESLAKATASGPKPSLRASEHVKSAWHIATTAKDKAQKARGSLASSIRQLAWVEQQCASTGKSVSQMELTDDAAFHGALDRSLSHWGALKSARKKDVPSTTTTGSYDSHTTETAWESNLSATSEDSDWTSVSSKNLGFELSM